ncbi:MAG: hypothetical protein ACQXXG_09915 [Candidatus Bathyarchaeia archaeon]|jgi:hypothetical protein
MNERFVPKKVMLPPALLELKEQVDTDFASVVSVNGRLFTVLPFRWTGLGAYREHYVSKGDKLPQTAYDWREHGVTYFAFPYENQYIISLYKSNSGVVRVQTITPKPGGTPLVLGMGATSEAAAKKLVKGMVEITRW